MTELIKGQTTKVFQNYPVPQREVCKISIDFEFMNSWLLHVHVNAEYTRHVDVKCKEYYHND